MTTGRFSHDNYTMTPQDILSRAYICQTMCVSKTHTRV